MTSPSRRMRFGYYDVAAFFAFSAYASASVVAPVSLVLIARDLGFPLEEGGMSAGGALHLGRTVPMVAAMLLCGFAAGLWGCRRTFGAAVLLMGIGIGLCSIAPVYGVLFLALLVAGVGEGVIEGLATPFVQKLHPDEPGRYINFTHAFWSVGVLVTVLSAGALLAAGVSWRLVVGAVALLAAVPAVMLLLPQREGRRYPDNPEPLRWRAVWERAAAILRTRRFWLYFGAMFLAGGGEYGLTFWTASHIQLHFGASAWAGGVGTACFAAGMIAGRTGWGYLLHQRHLRALVLWSALIGAVVTLGIPHAGSLGVLYAMLLVAGVATAPFWPSIQSHCADRMPRADATMLFILLSCAGIPGCGFITWLMGYVANQAGGLGPAFVVVPACYLALAALVLADRQRDAPPHAPRGDAA
ncbi:MAG TPA: MFS transporter [Chthonomonadales bacterium]|nr:MFS transporter [Chthonomonadales bacterium]